MCGALAEVVSLAVSSIRVAFSVEIAQVDAPHALLTLLAAWIHLLITLHGTVSRVTMVWWCGVWDGVLVLVTAGAWLASGRERAYRT